MIAILLLLLATTDPSSASKLLQEGLTSLMHGQLAPARQSLEHASHLDPTNGLIWSALAEVYLRSHDPDHASAAAAQAERTGAKVPAVQHALAMYYSQAGKPAQAASWEARYAERAADKGAAANRSAHWYLDANDEKDALPLAQRAAAQDATVAFEWAQYLLLQQQFTEAADLLSAALQTHATDPQLVLALGVARYGQRRFDEAISQFLAVIRLDPAIQQPYRFLGRMLDQAGSHLPEITSDCQRWADANPESAPAQLVLAKVLLTADSNDGRAEGLLRRSISLDSRDWEAHYELGTVLQTQHKYPEAATELQMATELDPKQPQPHYQLARVYDRLGQPDRARTERTIHAQLTTGMKAQ